MHIQFQPVTAENVSAVLNLQIKLDQKGFIEPVEDCLAEANTLALWRPVGVYVDEVLCGFAMYGRWEDEDTHGRVWLDRFLIDRNFQGNGYAKPVLRALIQHIQEVYGCDSLYLSLYNDNLHALAIYEQLGFRFNGELDINGESVMVLSLGEGIST